jgi:hypothetical protein
MDQAFPFLLAVMVVLAVLGAIWSARQRSRRREQLRQWAAGRGLRFDPGPDRTFGEAYPNHGIFDQGDSRYAYTLVAGLFGFRQEEFFEVEDTAMRSPPRVDLGAPPVQPTTSGA